MTGAKTYFLIAVILMAFAASAYSQIEISIPDTSIENGNSAYVPVLTGDLSGAGVISYQTTIRYNHNVLDIADIDVHGSLTESWGNPTINTNTPGEIRVVGFGVTPLTGAGILFKLKCETFGQPGDSSYIIIENFMFNNNSPQVATNSGLLRISIIPVQVLLQTNFPEVTELLVDGEFHKSPYSAIWIKGSTHQIGVEEFQDISTGVRCAFDSWGDGGDRIHTISVVSDTSITVTLKEQFFVDVQSEWGNPIGEAWYEKGDTARIGVDSLIINENQSKRLFLNWTGEGNGAYSGTQANTTVIVNEAITEVASWQNEFFLSTQVNIQDGGTVTPSPPGSWYKEDSLAEISAAGSQDFTFAGWSGDLIGTENPATIRMDSVKSVTANFAKRVDITFQTEPNGLKIEVDGQEFTAPQTFSWFSDEVHQVRVLDQPVSEGIRYSFSEWSDGGAADHEITVPLESTTYVAHFNKEYFLTTSVQPIGGGTVNPAIPGEWFIEGSSATVSAEASWDYEFDKWSGDVDITENPVNITMDGPKNIIAEFVYNPQQSEWRVNAGGVQYEDSNSNLFEKDQVYTEGSWGYVNGNDWHKYDEISNTDDDVLYQTERYGMSEYRFDLEDGDYLITLHFAEIYYFSTNKRVFSIDVEGKSLFDQLDIYSETGHDNAIKYTFSTQDYGATVRDGQLNISFASIKDEPKVSAIEIVRYVPETPQLTVEQVVIDFDSTKNQGSIDVRNSGGGELAWSIDQNHFVEWISSISPSNGTLSGGEHQNVVLTIDRTGFESGIYSGSIIVNSDAGSQNIELFMTVPEPKPILAIDPLHLNFGSDIKVMDLQIINNGDANLVWSASKIPDVSWIESLTPQSGELTPGSKQFMQVSINREGMTGGTYSGQIAVTSNGGDVSVTVQMHVGEDVEYRINAGGDAYTDISGNDWEPDRAYTNGGYGYVGGNTYETSDPIAETDDDVLFQSERWGLDGYQFDVPPGKYDIELLFAEVYYRYTNKRLFDVSIEGNTVLNNLDLYAEAGHDAALRYEFKEIDVTDGRLNVTFTASKDAAKISG
ncbi:hypothetical protein GF337_00545, partial [candidate division KSB1 bacterium]|nr:hypothetical protein [candidate division KSB1 bacterium]